MQSEFAVALSGGGHRATLFSLGALLALVDRGLNRRIVQISSVSGGSITNAFVAQRCRVEELAPGELDPIAAELIGTIVRRGVLSRAWIAVIVGSAAAVGVATGVALWRIGLPAIVGLVAGIVIVSGVLLSSGLIVQRLLNRRYFSPRRRPGRLGDLADRRVEHVFCSTDLVLGQPVHFSTWDSGTAWRLTGPAAVPYAAGGLSLAEVVRASSAFPGIPPLRLRNDARLGGPRRPGMRQPRTGVLFLADGGLWNNLGSHVLRENRILRGREGGGSGLPLLCVNSSAPGAASAPVAYSVPVVAQFAALFRTLKVLTVNTVQPRVKAIADGMTRRNALGTRPGPHDPLDVVVDLAGTASHEESVRAWCRDRDDVRASDTVHDRYRRDVVDRLAAWAADLDHEPSAADNDRLSGLVLSAVRGRPRGSAEAVGVLDRRTLDELVARTSWAPLRDATGGEDLSVPTTLDRVRPASAAALVLRGYANTWLSSLLLEPDTDGPPDDIVARVHAMAGVATARPPDRG